MAHATVRTRFGTLDVACDPAGVTFCAWRDGAERPPWSELDPSGDDDRAVAHRGRVVDEVRLFLRGRLSCFSVPLVLRGTELECAAWQCVATVPFGARASYGEIARAIGRPGRHRAIARAMSRSPYALLVPAHRIVGADGAMHGAAPGSRRAALLAFERPRPPVRAR